MARFRLSIFIILFSVAPFSYTQGIELSFTQIKMLSQNAEKGDLEAQKELAERYYKGDGLKQDHKQAVHWYKKLAETGIANAQLTLGLMYIKGSGIKKDDAQAVHWLTMAAEQRMSMAQYLLGVANEEGHGVKQDLIKAYMWYEIAAAVDEKNAIEAREELNKTLSPKEITLAVQMATDWWMQFH